MLSKLTPKVSPKQEILSQNVQTRDTGEWDLHWTYNWVCVSLVVLLRQEVQRQHKLYLPCTGLEGTSFRTSRALPLAEAVP